MMFLLRKATILLGCLTLISCTKTPVLTHDFSVLRDDFFSRLIKDIVSVDSNFLNVDVASGRALSAIEFSGVKHIDIYNNFYLADGGCVEISAEETECSVLRVWRYINEGGESYTSKQCIPGIRIIYEFHFSESPRVVSDLSMSYRALSFC